jgi:hypothetical protein
MVLADTSDQEMIAKVATVLSGWVARTIFSFTPAPEAAWSTWAELCKLIETEPPGDG